MRGSIAGRSRERCFLLEQKANRFKGLDTIWLPFD